MSIVKNFSKPVVLFFAIGTGLTTAAYVKNCKKIPDFFKNLWLIIALVISSAVLNYLLYKKDIDKNGINNPFSGFKTKDMPALVITLASSVTVFLFTLWSIPTLGYGIPNALIWLFAISAGLSTFFLFFNDTKVKIKDLAQGISSLFTSINFKQLPSLIGRSPLKLTAKIILTAIFAYGTYGYLNTTFATLKSHMSDNLYYLALTLIVLLAISEFIFIYASAEKFVDKTIDNIKNASLWQLLWIFPIALNASANGVLDAFVVSANRFRPALAAGIVLSGGLMSNETFTSSSDPGN